jgi:hypothetical protein
MAALCLITRHLTRAGFIEKFQCERLSQRYADN